MRWEPEKVLPSSAMFQEEGTGQGWVLERDRDGVVQRENQNKGYSRKGEGIAERCLLGDLAGHWEPPTKQGYYTSFIH